MTDAPLDPSRFVEGDALVFEAEEQDAPAAAPAAKRPRAPRKGKNASPVAETIAAVPEPVAPETVAAEAGAPDPVPEPASVPAAAAAPAPAPSALRRHALPALVCLSLMSSFASVGGLIAIGHSLAAIKAERTHAAGAPSPEALAASVARLDRAAEALSAAAARPVPAGPLTADDLRHGLDDLRLALAARQPAGVAALADQSRSSFTEIATRLDRIEAAVRRPAAARP